MSPTSQLSVVGLSSSPRIDGNSQLLTEAVLAGAATTGHRTQLVQLNDVIQCFLRDCRQCRNSDGECSIVDGYAELITGPVLNADVLVFGTPLYWYGVSGILKTFLDRIFCFISNSYPKSEDVRRRLMGKRLIVVLSGEESYEGATLGVRASMQELARYLHWNLIGFLVGVGNSRGEVLHDPTKPMESAFALGQSVGQTWRTDYRLDSARPSVVWAGVA